MFTVDVEERTRTHPCARAHNPTYQLPYLPSHKRDVLHSMTLKCLWLTFWELLHSVFYSFPFRGMLFFSESHLLFLLLHTLVRRLSILIFTTWYVVLTLMVVHDAKGARETATMCALPFLSHFSQILLLLSVCVWLCCCPFLFCFLDACVCFRFAVKLQDAVAGSIKSNMACMQTPCPLRLSIGVMCGRSTPYCVCSHPL